MRTFIIAIASIILFAGCTSSRMEVDYSVPLPDWALAQCREMGLGDISGAPGPPHPTDDAAFLKLFFPNFGVTFPEGSSLTYDRTSKSIRMTNTRRNCEIVERILTPLGSNKTLDDTSQ